MITQSFLFVVALFCSFCLWRWSGGRRQPGEALLRLGSILLGVYAFSVLSALLQERDMIAAYAVPWWAAMPMLWTGWEMMKSPSGRSREAS